MTRYIGLFVLAVLAFAAYSYASFNVPATLTEAELCGFVAADFAADGALAYPPLSAWWISMLRKQDYWIALSVGVSAVFVAFAFQAGRRASGTTRAGAAAGGVLVALLALCASCLAPVLAAVGLGFAATLVADVPKWLIALNTVLLACWGALLLSRRSAACPIPVLVSSQPIEGTRT